MPGQVLGRRFLIHALAAFGAFEAFVQGAIAALYDRPLEFALWTFAGAALYGGALSIQILKVELGE